MEGTTKELVLENMIFNTVIRAFAEENVPYTTASIIMGSVAGRIHNMALQAVTEENFNLRNKLAGTQQKKPEDLPEEGSTSNE